MDGPPTEVQLRAFLLDIDEVDSAGQTFTANFYYDATWKDARLAHEGPGPRTYPLEEIWDPQLQIVNQQKVFPTFPEVASVSPEGDVSYKQRVWGPFSQPLDLREFPFDSQSFAVVLVAAGCKADDIELRASTERLSGVYEEYSVPDWTVTSWEAAPEVYVPHPELGPTPGFVMRFEAKRHSGYYVWKVLAPLFFIVAMSWISFWIDPSQVGTQIGIATTSMLTLIAYRFMVDGNLPKVAYLTRMDSLILGATSLVFATLIEVALTGTLADRGKVELARRIDRVARVVSPALFVALIVLVANT